MTNFHVWPACSHVCLLAHPCEHPFGAMLPHRQAQALIFQVGNSNPTCLYVIWFVDSPTIKHSPGLFKKGLVQTSVKQSAIWLSVPIFSMWILP